MTKITIDRAVVEQALEALERYQVKRQNFDRFADEIAAFRAALAEPVQEPVQHYASIPGANVRVRLQAEPVEGEKT